MIEVLDSVVDAARNNAVTGQVRLEALAPIIDKITEFTDGDETRHARSDFIEAVAKLTPYRLPSLYELHLSRDEHSYADHCVVQFAKIANLDEPEGAAFARTLLDQRTLHVLEKRAPEEPTAKVLLGAQNAFLGRRPHARSEQREAEEELSEQEQEAELIDPSSFGPQEFPKLAEVASVVDYRRRPAFMSRWLQHCKNLGQGNVALNSIRSYAETSETLVGVDQIFDEAFPVSLAIQGKDAAYNWLVRAHVYRYGWSTYFTSEEETVTRLERAARYYSNRWQDYVRDTSLPAPFYRRRGGAFVIGYKYLVRFLLLVGEAQIADRIVSSLVQTLVEEVREQPIPEAVWFR